jgi:predicted Zn-dependent protease
VIPAQQVVELALQAAERSGRATETIVIVTDRSEASLRWAGNSMTTNGVATARSTTVISIVRKGDIASVGSRRSSDADPAAIAELVAAAEDAAHRAPEAADSAALVTGSGLPDDWNEPVGETGIEVFGDVAQALATGFTRSDRLYGYAHHLVETTFLATSTGVRRRFIQPTGTVELNAKRDGASAWAGISVPWFVDVPTDTLLSELSGDADGGPAPRTIRDAATAGGHRGHDDLPQLVDGWPRGPGRP